MLERRRLLIRGKVQGVWFRGACAREADRLGVAGRATNLADGSVEVVAEGEAAAVAALEAWCHHGPPAARVDGVEAVDEPVQGLKGFATR